MLRHGTLFNNTEEAINYLSKIWEEANKIHIYSSQECQKLIELLRCPTIQYLWTSVFWDKESLARRLSSYHIVYDTKLLEQSKKTIINRLWRTNYWVF